MAILTEEDRLSYRILFLIAVVGLLAIPVTALRLFAALVILCYLPAAPFAARTGLPVLSGLALTVTVSPLMIALPILVVMQFGLPVQTAVWAIVGIAMAQFLVYGTQHAFDPTRAERRLLVMLAVVVAVCAFLALWLPATNAWWRFREDSWFHAAVFHRIANHGLPVADPYFSPLRLQYMYFYHILLLTVSTLTGLGPFHAMIFTNFMALGSCVLGFNLLAGQFTERLSAKAMGAVLCVFGMNGLFYLFFPIRLARSFLGETRGVEVLRQWFSLAPLGHDSAVRFLSVEGNRFLFLDKFMIGTALSLTFGMVCVILALVVMRRGRGWNWLFSFFYCAALAGVLFLHVILGATVVVATAGLVAVLFFAGPRGRYQDGDFPVWLHAVLTVAAVAVAVPYLASVMPRNIGVGTTGLGLHAHQIIGIIACILPASIPAAWYLARGERPWSRGTGLRAPGLLVVWTAIVLVMAFVVDLPTNNESKFAFPLHLALSALAVGGIDRWLGAPSRNNRRRTLAAVAYVVACTLPLNAVYYASAFADRSEFGVSGVEWSLYDWIQKFTPEDALFLEEHDIVRIPVLAARDQYWGIEAYARNWGYPADELARRRELRDAVYGDGDLSEVDFDHVAALDRPFYVVLRDLHKNGGLRFQRFSNDPLFTGKYMTGSIVLFEVDLKRPREREPLTPEDF